MTEEWRRMPFIVLVIPEWSVGLPAAGVTETAAGQ
jgi:hypothetical protein